MSAACYFSYSAQSRISLLNFLPWFFILPGDITAAMHDRKEQHATGFQAIHDTIVLHNDFPVRFIISFQDKTAHFLENPAVVV